MSTTAADEAPGDVTRPVVVLVHGLGLSSRYLLPTAAALAGEFRVLAPDLPGFGRSSRPARALTLPELADALAAWMDALELERVAVLGHSLGAQVVGHLADRHPDRVHCAALVSPSRDPQARWPWQQALRLLRDAPRETPTMMALAITDYLWAGPRRMWQTLRDGMATDAADRLRRITSPTLVVRGDRDTVVSHWWARTVTALLPDGHLIEIPGGPHGLPHSHPRALAEVLRPFLRQHLRGC